MNVTISKGHEFRFEGVSIGLRWDKLNIGMKDCNIKNMLYKKNHKFIMILQKQRETLDALKISWETKNLRKIFEKQKHWMLSNF